MTGNLYQKIQAVENLKKATESNEVRSVMEFKLLNFNNYVLTLSDILIVVFILVLTKYFIRLLNSILDRFAQRKKIEDRNKNTFVILLKYLIWIFTIVVSLEVIGFKITLFLAGSAALLVGLGLGLQAIFSDIVSGVFLLMEGSVKIGDIMEVDGLIGKVLKINLRTSEIFTRTGIIIIVPNHKFITENVVNWSHNATMTRFSVGVGVGYESDPALVKKILLECAATHGSTADKKPYEPFVRLIDFGESSLDFEVHFWSKEGFGIENIKSDLRFMILNKFRKNNVAIPFPQRDMNFKNTLDFRKHEDKMVQKPADSPIDRIL